MDEAAGTDLVGAGGTGEAWVLVDKVALAASAVQRHRATTQDRLALPLWTGGDNAR